MDVSVTWSSGMSFSGTGPSGFVVPLGTDPAVGGADDGFRPVELLAISLAGCTAMDVISILGKKREQVSSFEVFFHGERQAEHPKVITAGHILYRLSGAGINEASVRRAIELSVTKYCPAFAMLSRVFPIETHYEIFEDGGDGSRQKVVEGVYAPEELMDG
jgi:putative redox protein